MFTYSVLLNKSSLHNRKYVLKGDSRGEPDKKRPETKKNENPKLHST
jgi:hypothetical protein